MNLNEEESITITSQHSRSSSVFFEQIMLLVFFCILFFEVPRKVHIETTISLLEILPLLDSDLEEKGPYQFVLLQALGVFTISAT